MNRAQPLQAGIRWLLFLAVLFPCVALAQAGQVIFVKGNVSLATGAVLTKGTVVSEGDEIVTGADGYAQLLMRDGDRIALRPNSRFRIETYQVDESTQFYSSGVQIKGKRVYNLLMGGFRTLTNKDGTSKEGYEVRTPVATIGIRGTDYVALLEELLNSPSGFGLYIGVHDGTIWVQNNAGTTDVYDGEYFYVESLDDPGVKLLAPPELYSEGEAPSSGFWLGANAAGVGEEGGVLESRRSPPAGPSPFVDPDPPIDPKIPVLSFNQAGQLVILHDGVLPRLRYNAFASGPLGAASGFSGTSLNPVEVLGLDASGNLTSFPGLYASSTGPVLGFYDQGTSALVNQGFDPVSGLRWGRWTGGQASVTHAGGTDSIDLSQQSLHWIVSREHLQPAVLPIHGVYEYRLVGGTDPTDNFGNVGFMNGTSHMQADFTNQTISTQISLGINGQQWNGEDFDGSFGQNGTFAGQFDSVTVNDQGPCGNGCNGSGGYSGYFSGGDGSGPPPGAGMGYNMEERGTSVSGTAAFGDPQDAGAE